MRVTEKPPIGATVRVPSIGIRGVVVSQPKDQTTAGPTVIWATWVYERNGLSLSGGTPLRIDYYNYKVFLVEPPEDVLWD